MKLTEKKLKEIISESIKKYLKENNQPNITIESIANMIGVKYYQNEPDYLLGEFKIMIEDVINYEVKKSHGNEPVSDIDYPDCNPELIGKYIDVYRNQMNKDYMSMFTNLKEKQINANEVLDKLTQKYINFKQNGEFKYEWEN